MKTMRERFTEATARALDQDPGLALVLADIGVRSFAKLGVFERHPHRVVNVGIREALAIGLAAGFAREGLRPIVHTYAPFLVERPFEQIKLDLVHQALPATLVSIGASYDAAAEGRTHQAPGDVALLSTLPGVRVELPGHPGEVEPALERGFGHDGLAYIRLSTQVNREAFDPGVHALRHGSLGSVLAIGPVLDAALEATAGLDVTVFYTATARPLDAVALRALAPRQRPFAVIEPVTRGTSAHAVAEAFGLAPPPVLSLGVAAEELRRYGSAAEHATAHGLDAASLRARLEPFVRRAA